MDLTLLEAANYSDSPQVRAVSRQITESSPVLEKLPVRTIPGAAYVYPREISLGSIGYRGVGGSYTPDSGVIRKEVETLSIFGGEIFIDNFEIDTMGGSMAIKPTKFMQKSRQMGIFFSQEFFEGDKTVTPAGMDGLRRRITGNQLIDAANGGTAGATLTLAMLDQLIDTVLGGPDAIYMNKTLRRKVTALVRAQTGSGLINYSQDAFGRQQMRYADVPLLVVEREDDASTILDFDEANGGGQSTTASMYAVKYGMEFVHGIATKALPGVKDFGETEARPGTLGRIEWFAGIAIEHPRAAARLYHINNA